MERNIYPGEIPASINTIKVRMAHINGFESGLNKP